MQIKPLILAGCLFVGAVLVQPGASAQKVQGAEQTAPETSRGRKAEPNVGKAQGPHLRMDHPTYNFGDVPRKGGDLVHDFVFTNDGTVPLVVTRVITSCSCLKASYSKRPVAPGDSAVIRITYEPHKSEPGTFNKVIQVYSNSVDGRDVITVQGNSIPDPQPDVKVKGDKVKIK